MLEFIKYKFRYSDKELLKMWKYITGDYVVRSQIINYLKNEIELLVSNMENQHTAPLDKIGSSPSVKEIDMISMIEAKDRVYSLLKIMEDTNQWIDSILNSIDDPKAVINFESVYKYDYSVGQLQTKGETTYWTFRNDVNNYLIPRLDRCRSVLYRLYKQNKKHMDRLRSETERRFNEALLDRLEKLANENDILS